MSRALITLRAVLVTLLACAGTFTISALGAASARASLPDGRRYEKVSPNENAQGNVTPPAPKEAASFESFWTYQPFVAAANGSAVAYMADPSETGGTGKEGAGAGNQYLARRTGEAGWSAVNIEPNVGNSSANPAYQAFNENLTAGFLVSNGQEPLTPGAPGEAYGVLYKRDLTTMAFEPLFVTRPSNRTAREFGAPNLPVIIGEPRGASYAGSSEDQSHMFFVANDALTQGAIDGGFEANNLYDSHGGELTLVNVLPDGSTQPNAIFGGPILPYDPSYGNGPALTHAISEDGTRVYWTDLNNGNLYLRENDATTVQVDAAVGGDGAFWTASPDGSRALFTKGGDLYEYNAVSGQDIDLTPGAEVQGIVSTSKDLSYIYFVADAALASGAKAQTCQYGESATRCNLYVLHRGEPVRFIAALSPTDNESTLQTVSSTTLVGDWQPGLGAKEAQAAPDGRSLVFTSSESLTGYDNVSHERGEPRNDEEVFVYDFEGAKLFCASCNPTGEAPKGFYSAFLPVSYMETYSHRWISADGTKVFFDSVDPLVSQDTNGLMDVYEWEQDGSGSCESVQGCIYLLSAGNSPEGSFLADASESGDDVFITTRSQLVPEDENENSDLYDVRANAPRLPAAPQCAGTGCQGVPSAPPVFSTPSSVTYGGVGNFQAPAKATVKPKKAKKKRTRRKPAKKRKGVGDKSKKASHKTMKSQGGRK